MDYHNADVHRSVRYPEGGTRSWFANCECGWSGLQRPSMDAANDDAIAHDMANNKERGGADNEVVDI